MNVLSNRLKFTTVPTGVRAGLLPPQPTAHITAATDPAIAVQAIILVIFLASFRFTLPAEIIGRNVHDSFQLGCIANSRPCSHISQIALDSNPFAQSPYLPPLNPYAELTWLDSQLAAAQSAGQKVWLIMHVPPGANATATAQNAAKGVDPNPQTDDEAAMMWQPQYQIEFMQILSKYPGLVAMGNTGHTHMDEFRVLPTGDVLLGIPTRMSQP